jgi:hypothetical protein
VFETLAPGPYLVTRDVEKANLMIADATQRSPRAVRRFVNRGQARAIPWRN